MRQIKADPLPVISQKWSQEDEDKKTYYISPSPKRCRKWIKDQTELFQRCNPKLHPNKKFLKYIFIGLAPGKPYYTV